MDKWVLSGLNTLIKVVDEGLNEYKITETARAIGAFVDDLSNWYVRRCRDRFWGSGMTKDKEAAYTTLYTVLSTLAKIIAPYVPFMAENMYQNLVVPFFKDAPESVHLCDFPVADEQMVDKFLEEGMKDVLAVVMLGRAARNLAGIKNRQPLRRLIYNGKKELSSALKALVEDELNVKDVQISSDSGKFISYELKPQLKTLGPKFGALLGKIRQILAEHADEIVAAVRNAGTYTTEADGRKIELTEEDLLISVKSREGYSSESDGETTVALDTTLDDELIFEGAEREIISKIQTMRKEAGFDVTDHIEVGYRAEGVALEVFRKGAFAKDVLCDRVTETIDGYAKEWNINGDKVTVSVRKIG